MAIIQSDVAQWTRFFKESGISPVVASAYGNLFVKHRIRPEMLSDLTKEFLYDMGINVMGDVILILKHAKSMILAPARLGSSTLMVAPQLSKTVSQSVTQQPSGIQRRPAVKPVQNKLAEVDEIRKELRKEKFQQGAPSRGMLKRKGFQSNIGGKKTKRETPEYEGGFVVKMPRGITPKTRRLMRQKQLEEQFQSVFDRLGQDNVSSSAPKKSRTTFGSLAADLEDSSVFERLGRPRPNPILQRPTETMTRQTASLSLRQPKAIPQQDEELSDEEFELMDDEDEDDSGEDSEDDIIGEDQLQYQGVLKQSPQSPRKPIQTVYYDKESPVSILKKPTPAKKSVSFTEPTKRAQIGRLLGPQSQGIFGLRNEPTERVSIRDRLGSQKPSTIEEFEEEDLEQEDFDEDNEEFDDQDTVSTVMRKSATLTISRPNRSEPTVSFSSKGLGDVRGKLTSSRMVTQTRNVPVTVTGRKGSIFSRLGAKNF